MNNLRIALDIDDTILKWFEAYQKRFPGERNLVQHIITRNVRKLQYDKEFLKNNILHHQFRQYNLQNPQN